MSEQKKYEIAKKIVDKQLDTMKKYSAAPKVCPTTNTKT
jgi:hypothetical protein